MPYNDSILNNNTVMLLTDTVINTATPTTKPFKLRDGRGMYLLIMPNGSKYFRLDYRLDGKRLTLALGVYPDISLDEARASLEIARKQIKDGIKPTLNTVKGPHNERPKQPKMLEELTQAGLKETIDLFTRDAQQKKQSAIVRDLEHQLQDARKRSDELQSKHATFMLFSKLTKEQQEMLFTQESPAPVKLKELSQLSVDRGIGNFTDDQLVKELEHRGFEVSIYK